MSVLSKSSLIIGGVAILAAASPTFADNGRFTMEKTEEGYVRMDTQSGAMSLCTTENGQIVCKMAADERGAFDADIAALEKRVEALEAQIESRGFISENVLPTDEEFERGLGYMEKFMRRFMGIAKELDGQGDRT